MCNRKSKLPFSNDDKVAIELDYTAAPPRARFFCNGKLHTSVFAYIPLAVHLVVCLLLLSYDICFPSSFLHPFFQVRLDKQYAAVTLLSVRERSFPAPNHLEADFWRW
jgi:hypothetical protein